MAKFSKTGVWDKFRREVPSFLEIPKFPQTTMWDRWKEACMSNPARFVQSFRYNTSLWRAVTWTDGHMTTNTALELRRALKSVLQECRLSPFLSPSSPVANVITEYATHGRFNAKRKIISSYFPAACRPLSLPFGRWYSFPMLLKWEAELA